MSSRLLAQVALAATLAVHASATNLMSVSGDPNNSFVPDQFSSLTDSPGSVVNAATLGNGSLGFNGGLTFGPGSVFYAIANDSLGASSFYTVQSNGTIALVGAAGGLGSGFLGGLAYDSANATFYAAVNDFMGNSTLDSITPGGVAAPTGLSVGTGFSGLAYDTSNGLFYGIGNDVTGFSTLYNFALGGPVNPVGGLGFGFGALTYDPAQNLFWAISPVNNSGSQLFQITSSGGVSAPFYTLGDGFVELAAGSAGGVPEPASFVLMGAGLIFLSGISRRIARDKFGGKRP